MVDKRSLVRMVGSKRRKMYNQLKMKLKTLLVVLVEGVILVRIQGGDCSGKCSPLLAPAAADVSLVEESNKQDEVRCIHDEGDRDRLFLHLAVRALPDHSVGVRNDKDAGQHLGDLQRRDGHGNGFAQPDAQTLDRIVGVHEEVDDEVDAHEVAAKGRSLRGARPGEEEDGDVVIPVQEDDGPLAEDQEDRVSQLHDLGQSEGGHPEAAHIAGTEDADAGVHVVTGEHVAEIVHDACRADQREHG